LRGKREHPKKKEKRERAARVGVDGRYPVPALGGPPEKRGVGGGGDYAPVKLLVVYGICWGAWCNYGKRRGEVEGVQKEKGRRKEWNMGLNASQGLPIKKWTN